ncbi:MAG: hypothetical protein ACR2P7_08215 [bacterium]
MITPTTKPAALLSALLLSAALLLSFAPTADAGEYCMKRPTTGDNWRHGGDDQLWLLFDYLYTITVDGKVVDRGQGWIDRRGKLIGPGIRGLEGMYDRIDWPGRNICVDMHKFEREFQRRMRGMQRAGDYPPEAVARIIEFRGRLYNAQDREPCPGAFFYYNAHNDSYQHDTLVKVFRMADPTSNARPFECVE